MGNRLTTAVNVSVRKTFRRVATGKPPNGAVNGNGNGHTHYTMDEETPLLAGEREPTHDDGGAFWWALFFNNKSTPGTGHPNPLVRWPAQIWNVAKVTLLSCTYALSMARTYRLDTGCSDSNAPLSQLGSTSSLYSCLLVSSLVNRNGAPLGFLRLISSPSFRLLLSSRLRPKRLRTGWARHWAAWSTQRLAMR